MFSGWGIRTYAAGQPGYNPIGYHTGTVWPHDTSLIAAGLKRYGFDEEAEPAGRPRSSRRPSTSPDFRLPELFCGFDRDDAPRPGPVPGRLLAAGLGGRRPSFLFLETMLGPARRTRTAASSSCVRPQLPDWLGKVDADEPARRRRRRWTCCSTAGAGTTSAEVLRKVGDLDVTIRM